MTKRGLGLAVADYGIATGLHHNKLTVPPNQRSYAWEEAHVQTLFEDISAAIADRKDNYFLGTIVLTQGEENILEVADGQQRLATTSILIAAIRDFLLDGGVAEKKAATKFTSDFLLDYDVSSGESIPKLQLNHEDRDYFHKRILLTPDETERGNVTATALSHKRLDHAAQIAKDHVINITAQFGGFGEKAKILYAWIEFLQKAAIVIEIRVPQGVDAFKMFETLNDRGLRASQTDILKNYLFGNVKDRITEIQIKWASMNATIEAIGDADLLLTYLRHYWTLSHGYTAERELADQVQGEITSKQQAVNMVIELDNYAADYTGLLSPLEYMGWEKLDKKTRAYIYVITRILSVDQVRPLLLAIVKKFEPQQAKEALKMILSWSVRFMIAGSGGGGPLDRGYGQLAKEVMGNIIKTAGQLREKIGVGILRADADFKDTFSKCRVSKNDLARYYLRALELHQQGNQEAELGGTLDDTFEFNLEHVMPQNPSDQWSIPPETVQLFRKRLGNMALLNPDTNLRLGNKSFAEKKPVYLESPGLLTQMIGGYNDWGPTEIEDRQKKLADIALKIWNL